MNIFLSAPVNAMERYFPKDIIERIATLGELTVNDKGYRLSPAETLPYLSDADIVITHWGGICYNEEILKSAPKLKLIAHCAGSVASIASEASYQRGIKILSANPIMAKYVAEWTLGAIISGLREFPAQDAFVRCGKWRPAENITRSLYDTDIGLIGLGAVGRWLLDLLRPFGCKVAVYDPYISDEILAPWENAYLCSFEEAMDHDVVSVHASKTPETYHLINAEALAMIPNGGLLINSARSSIIDTDALINELSSGRISAALDVYDQENVKQDDRLLSCSNVILSTHAAAVPAGRRMTDEIVDDIERFIRGEKLNYTVTYDQFSRMTR